MTFAVRSVLAALAVLLVTPAANAKPLTMRSAERAIDLGLEAELAGDAAGAERSLLEVIGLATRAEETAPRERIASFVRSLSLRREAFAQHGKTARAYAAAYDSMLPFGLERAERLWAKAVADVPALGAAPVPKVALRLDLVKGAEERAVVEQLERAMKRYGISLADPKDARFVVRVNLDATGVKRDPRGVRVFAEASAVVSDRTQPKRAAGSMSKQRSERRTQETAARRFALYRVLDDVGRRVVFAVRSRMLEDAAPPT
jgi:hypothetical protein